MKDLSKNFKGIRVTSLPKFETSPKLFKLSLDNLLEEERKAWATEGTKTHMFLLQEKEFKENYTYLEFTTPSSPKQKEFCEELVKAYKRNNNVLDISLSDIAPEVYKRVYVVSGKSEDKIKEETIKTLKSLEKYINYLLTRDKYKDILSYTSLKFLNSIKFETAQHQLAKELILFEKENSEYYSEFNILWEHPFLKINNEPIIISSTIDRLIIDHKNKLIQLVDVKTTSNIGEFEHSFRKYHYDRQLAAYQLALQYWFNNNDNSEYKNYLQTYTLETYIVALQKDSPLNENPIECRVFPIGDISIQEGEDSLNKVLEDISWHFENNKWDHTRSYYENKGLEKAL